MANTANAILIKLRDPGALAKSQGGAVGGLAAGILPATTDALVYDKVKGEIDKSLKSRGIEADVSVVEPGAFRPASGNHLWVDLGLAIGGAGVVGLLWWLASRHHHRGHR